MTVTETADFMDSGASRVSDDSRCRPSLLTCREVAADETRFIARNALISAGGDTAFKVAVGRRADPSSLSSSLFPAGGRASTFRSRKSHRTAEPSAPSDVIARALDDLSISSRKR